MVILNEMIMENNMKSSIAVRRAVTDDLPQIIDLIKRVIIKLNEDRIFIWDDFYPANFIEEEILQQRLYVVSLEENIFSCFALNPVNRGSEKVKWPHVHSKALYLDKFCVDPKYQRQGMGQKIIQEALKISGELGYTSLRLFVVDFNTPALEFYENCEFVRAEGLFFDKIEERTLTEIGFEKNIKEINMLESIKGKLVISCQALPEEPLHSSFIMGRMALAAQQAGASGIRAQGVEDIIEIMNVVDLPVIGIIKRNYDDSDVYITPTKKEVDELLQTNCQMIALDATDRRRPGDEKLQDLVDLIHQHGRLAMADCSTLEEALMAQEIGFDCVSSTLAGYTPYSKLVDGPNFELLSQMIEKCTVPVIAEGKINTPQELKAVMDLNVHSAVVGGAITRPQQIAKRFIEAIQ